MFYKYSKYVFILLCATQVMVAQPTRLERAKVKATELKIKAVEKMKVGVEKAKVVAKYPATWVVIAMLVAVGIVAKKSEKSFEDYMSDVSRTLFGA